MSEPGCGSDVSAIKTRAVRDGDEYVIDGQKMWLTNGARAGVVATLVKTDEGGDSVYRNMTTFLIEKEPGFGEQGGLTIPGKIDKMGYKGVETTEMILEGHRVPASAVLGGEAGRGKGFYQMMDGVEVGRVNVAARGCGIMRRAFELGIAVRPAAHDLRQADRRPPGHRVQARRDGHQGRGRPPDDGQRRPAEGRRRAQRRRGRHGQAARLRVLPEVTTESFRIHGGYGYSKEYEIERLFREAPFLLIGEGTSEIQKTIISRGLLKDYKLNS